MVERVYLDAAQSSTRNKGTMYPASEGSCGYTQHVVSRTTLSSFHLTFCQLHHRQVILFVLQVMKAGLGLERG